MGISCVDLDKINLDDPDCYKDDPETIIHVIFLVWRYKIEKRKAYKTDLRK